MRTKLITSKIMERHHQYVPKVKEVNKVSLHNGKLEEMQTINTWNTLFGGATHGFETSGRRLA